MKKILLIIPFFLWTCGGGGSSPTESEQNQAPVALDLNIDVSRGHTTRILLKSSINNNSRSYVIIGNPVNGSVYINNPNSARALAYYSHDPSNDNKNDLFTYQVSSDGVLSNIATVSMQIYQSRIFYSDIPTRFYKVIPTSDGGFIAVGSARGSRGHIIKLDNLLNQNWQVNESSYSIAYDIFETSDGGFIISGTNMLKKINSSGDDEWSINNTDSTNEVTLPNIKATSDGGFISVGFYKEKQYLIKIDNSGNEQWSTSFGDDDSVIYRLNDVVEYNTSSGVQYITWGNTFNNNIIIDSVNYQNPPFYSVYDSNGNHVSTTFEKESNVEYKSTLVSSNGDYILVGGTTSYSVVKVYDIDNMTIKKINSFEPGIIFRSISETADGGFILAGHSNTHEDGFIAKLDSSCETIWIRSYDMYENSSDTFYSVKETNEGTYVIGGWTDYGYDYNNAYIVKIDSQGNLIN